MDAIEYGIVKLPRVPIADNIPGGDMPKKGRGKAGQLDPLKIPVLLQTALEALYGHYAKLFALWESAVCLNRPSLLLFARTRRFRK